MSPAPILSGGSGDEFIDAGGGATPVLADYGRTAAEVVNDPALELNVTIQMTGKHRVTRALRDFFVSFHPMGTDALDTPPLVVMPPYVASVGGVTMSLSEDLVFAGVSTESYQPVNLRNSQGELDHLADYIFNGYPIVARIGGLGEPHRLYAPLWTATIRGEPLIGASQVTVQPGPPLPQLDEAIPFARYIGIPVALRILTTSGIATVSSTAPDLDLGTYAIVARFRLPANPSIAVNILRKTGTLAGYLLSINPAGQVTFAADLSPTVRETLLSPLAYCDGAIHTIAAARGLDTWYLRIDGRTVIRAVPSGLCVTATAGIVFAERFDAATGGGEIFDVRIYPFKDEIELDALAAQRAEGAESDALANWRFDDAIGSTATDYAAARHASIAGTEGTDFAWVQTNEGEPPMAGQAKPITDGLVAQTLALPIDGGQATAGSKPRYQIADRAGTQIGFAISSRGAALALGTDWSYVQVDGSTSSVTNATGVIQMASAQSEPLTAETVQGGAAVPIPYLWSPDVLLRNLLLDRAGVAAGSLHLPLLGSLGRIAPFNMGYACSEGTTYSALIAQILQGILAHRRTLRDGRMAAGFLLPPVSPGPFGGSVLEFTAREAIVRFPAAAGLISGSHTIVGWFRSFAAEAVVTDDITVPNPGQIIFDRLGGGGGVRLQLLLGKQIEFFHPQLNGGASLTTPLGAVGLFGSYMVMAVYDESAHTRTIYVARPGGAAVQVAQQSGVTGAVTSSPDVEPTIGNFVGACGHVAVYPAALSGADATAIFAAGPPAVAGASFYAPIDEGEGKSEALEIAGGFTGSIEGLGDSCRWAPRAVFDLRRLVAPGIEMRGLVPAWDVSIESAHSYRPLEEAEISLGITDPRARMALRRTGLYSFSRQPALHEDNPDARTVHLASLLRQRDDGDHLLRNALLRLGEGRAVASLANAGRRALLLELTDEVRVYASRLSLDSGLTFRVAGISPKNDQLTADLTLLF